MLVVFVFNLSPMSNIVSPSRQGKRVPEGTGPAPTLGVGGPDSGDLQAQLPTEDVRFGGPTLHQGTLDLATLGTGP